MTVMHVAIATVLKNVKSNCRTKLILCDKQKATNNLTTRQRVLFTEWERSPFLSQATLYLQTPQPDHTATSQRKKKKKTPPPSCFIFPIPCLTLLFRLPEPDTR